MFQGDALIHLLNGIGALASLVAVLSFWFHQKNESRRRGEWEGKMETKIDTMWDWWTNHAARGKKIQMKDED